MTGVPDSSVPLSAPVLQGREAEYLQDCVETGFVSSAGRYVDRFEQAVVELSGASAAVAVSSGTAALQLSLVALRLPLGGEVWLPSLTFIATANAVVHAGGRPTFVDSAPGGLEMDPELVLAELHRRLAAGEKMPAAIIPVHLYGEPVGMPWLELARSAGVAVIEDAAESVGSRWTGGPFDGRHTGTVGDLGCFSFNGNKIVTAGGGGVVVGNAGLIGRIRHLSTQARVPDADYEHDEVGFNHRLTNLCAAVGVAQLEQLEQLVGGRKAIHRRYVDALDPLGAVSCLRWSPDANCWLTVIAFATEAQRDRARRTLLAQNVSVRGVWPPLHRQLPYRQSLVIGTGLEAERLAATGLCLPSTPGLDPSVQDRIVRLLELASTSEA